MKRILSMLLVMAILLSSACFFTSCSDKELEAFTGELYSEILPIKNGAKGIITIVHDDGDLDTVEFMKREFTKFGLCGTVAMVGNKVVDSEGNETGDAAKWKKLIKEGGFDIVCHSQTHSFFGLTDEAESGTWPHRDGYDVEYDFPAGNVTNELAGCAERLRKVFKDSDQKVCCFAIPGLPVADDKYAATNEIATQVMAEHFVACRQSGGVGVFGDVTVPCLNNLQDLNYQRLNSYAILTTEENPGVAWNAYVDAAVEYGGWGIFLFHQMIGKETDYIYNVSKTKSTKLFKYIGEKVKSGELWCATMTEATLYTKEIETAAAVVTVSGKGISVAVYDDLEDNETYDQPLTVKVQVLDTWETVKIKYDGEKIVKDVLTAEDGTKYVLVDVAPDKGAAVINRG